MIIDAGMGRSCCGMGSYPTTYPTTYPAGCGCCTSTVPACPYPTPTPAPDAGSAISNRQNVGVAALAVGDSVPFDSTSRVVGTDLTYDSTANAFVINTAGTYYFTWNVLAASSDGESDVLLRLQTLDGMNNLAYSGAVAVPATGSTLISGSTIAALPAGASVVLVNAGTTPVVLPEAGTTPMAFAADMTVVRIG